MSKTKYAILGCGNPLMDISQEVDQEFLDKYKVKLNDCVLAEEHHMPVYKELAEDYKKTVQYIAGGATQNSIRVAQWVLKASGKKCAYIGSIGKDKFGDELQKCIKGDSVDAYYHVDEKENTGVCACLIKDGERSLIPFLGAANNYKISHIEQKEIWSVVENAELVYIGGFFLTVSPETILKVAKHCHENKKKFLLNLSAPFICQFFSEPLLKALEYVDIIIGNESEGKAFAEHTMKDKVTTPEHALELLFNYPSKDNKGRIAIVTQGTDPTLVMETKDDKKSYDVEKIPKEKIVDANGAGDAFVGGLIAGITLGKTIAESVKIGQKAAGYIVQISGTHIPTEEFEF